MGFALALAGVVMTGCDKKPDAIVNDAYKAASENKFENIAAYVLPDSVDKFSEDETKTFASLAAEGFFQNDYSSFTVDSVVMNPEQTEAKFVVKTTFKNGLSYTESGLLRKTANGAWRLMVDKEATDTTNVYSVSDKTKKTPELMRNLNYATVMTLAGRGLPQYQVMAADILKEGVMTTADDERAHDLLKSAVDKNYVPSYRQLADMYYDGSKHVNKDYEKAFDLYLKAAEAGDANSYSAVGYAYREGEGTMKDYQKAKEWYEKGIEAGDPNSFRHLGYMYSPDFKGFETDNDKVFDLWTKGYEAAVKSSNSREMALIANNIGACYAEGWGVQKDVDKKIEWYTKAAESDDKMAMRNLAILYYRGLGVPKDFDKAFYWFSKADKAGNLEARYYVGECYEYGRGVEMNKSKAKQIYWDLWNKHSDKDARKGYERLYDY